jgi:hypothetical protein
MGYSAVADKLEDTWSAISRAMGIVEDYYGFYESEFLPAIQQTIDDMVVEAEPRNFANKEVFVLEEKVFASSPIQLLNQAWCKFLQEPKSYSVWEKSAITAFLGSN